MEVTADSSFVSSCPLAAGTDSPVQDSGHAAALRAKILRRIDEQTLSAAPPKVWSFLGPSNSVRRISGDINKLIASLTSEFAEAELRGTSPGAGRNRSGAVVAGFRRHVLEFRDPARYGKNAYRCSKRARFAVEREA